MTTLSIPDMADPVPQDIEEAVARLSPQVIDALRDARMFITGGTGFLGSWLVDILLAANQRHRLNLHMTLLTRKKSALGGRRPDWMQTPELFVIEGDVCDFECPGSRACD